MRTVNKLIETVTASVTIWTFKDDALEVTVILHWMKRVCVKFFKVYDVELCRKFSFDFGFRNGKYCI